MFLGEYSRRDTVPYLDSMIMIILMKRKSIFEFYLAFLLIFLKNSGSQINKSSGTLKIHNFKDLQ